MDWHALTRQNRDPSDEDGDLYVICSCGAEWWLDYEPPACGCPGDDSDSQLELRRRP